VPTIRRWERRPRNDSIVERWLHQRGDRTADRLGPSRPQTCLTEISPTSTRNGGAKPDRTDLLAFCTRKKSQSTASRIPVLDMNEIMIPHPPTGIRDEAYPSIAEMPMTSRLAMRRSMRRVRNLWASSLLRSCHHSS
jgi:hypothetical protein